MSASPPLRTTLAEVNALDRAEFTALLGGIYEHSPWVAHRCWPLRPFPSVAGLQAALAQVLDEASADEQLAVMRAHPQLSGKAAVRSDLTADSQQEQAGAGLNHCTAEEFAQLQSGNRAYEATFGFPFIIAVKGLGRQDIIAALHRRLDSSPEQEFAQALAQIHRIAAFRLADKIAG